MDEKKISTVLKSIGFSHLLQYFIDEEFTYETFKLLTPELVKDFLPKAGPRTLFWSKYTKYFQNLQAAKVMPTKFYTDISEDIEDPLGFTLEESISRSPPENSSQMRQVSIFKQDPELSQCDMEETIQPPVEEEEEEDYEADSTPVEISQPSKSNANISVENEITELLNLNGVSGVMIINKYNKFKALDDRDRTQLCKLIIHKEFERSTAKGEEKFKISTCRFIQLRDLICETFPNEIPDVYYVPYNKKLKSQSAGKLYASFNLFKRQWKEAEASKGDDTDEQNNPEEEFVETDFADEIRELQNMNAITEKALQLWKKTHNHRQKLLSSGKYTITKYYDQFPLLKQHNGYQLLLFDFDMMYKTQTKNLLQNWPLVNQKLIKFAKKKMNKYKFREFSAMCTSEIFGFILLTYHLPMSYTTSKTKKRIRLTREELQDELIFLVKDSESLWNDLEADNERRKKAGTPINPRIIFVGRDLMNVYKVYVEFDMNIYEMKTPLSAIDTYLKATLVFNLSYSNEVKQIWTFMQHYVYKIRTSKDVAFTSVNALMADMDNVNVSTSSNRTPKRKYSSDSE